MFITSFELGHMSIKRSTCVIALHNLSSNLLMWYRIRGFFTPLNFHELFWIREIKFMKCCRNVIVILVSILKFLVKTHGFVKI